MACQLLQRPNTSRVGALAAPASRSAQLIAQAGAVPDVGPRPAAGYRCQAPAFLGEAATDGCSKRAGYLAEYTRPDSPAGHTVNSNSAHTSSGTWSRTVIGRADWLSGVKAAAVALYPRSNCAASVYRVGREIGAAVAVRPLPPWGGRAVLMRCREARLSAACLTRNQAIVTLEVTK